MLKKIEAILEVSLIAGLVGTVFIALVVAAIYGLQEYPICTILFAIPFTIKLPKLLKLIYNDIVYKNGSELED